MFCKWIYLIMSIILTIFFLGLAWYGETLLPLLAVFVIGWDAYKALKPIPPRNNRARARSQQPVAHFQVPLQRRREVNLFTDIFIIEEEFNV